MLKLKLGIVMFLVSTVTVVADVLPEAKVHSKQRVVIYENDTTTTATITVQATDQRAALDSQLIPSAGVKKYTVPDGTTKAFLITVPPAATISFECNGTGTGDCTYALATPVGLASH